MSKRYMYAVCHSSAKVTLPCEYNSGFITSVAIQKPDDAAEVYTPAVFLSKRGAEELCSEMNALYPGQAGPKYHIVKFQ